MLERLVRARFASLFPASLHPGRFDSGSKRVVVLSTCLETFSTSQGVLIDCPVCSVGNGCRVLDHAAFEQRFTARKCHVSLAWVSLVLINAGLTIGALQLWFSSVILLGRIFEISAAIVFVVGSWRRVKPNGIL